MHLNCGVGEDSLESLGLQRRSNQSILNVISPGCSLEAEVFIQAEAETPILWPPHVKSWLIGKDPDAGRGWGQEEKGTTEDEMAGWHHRLNGHEFEWTSGVGNGQGKSQTRLSDWTELNWQRFWKISRSLSTQYSGNRWYPLGIWGKKMDWIYFELGNI